MPANDDKQYGASRSVAVGCQPMETSRVPAKERSVAGQCKRTEPGGGCRKGGERASHHLQTGQSKDIWTTVRPGRDYDVTNQGFPHQRDKPSKQRPTSTESPRP